MKILSLLSGNTVTLSNGNNDVKVYKQDIAINGFNAGVSIVVKQSNGKFLVGGSFTSYNGVTAFGLIRLNSDYTVDTTFNIGTGFRNGAAITAIIVQSNGRILVGGSFSSFNNTLCSGIIRLTSTGSLDTTFNSNIGTSNASVNAMVLLSSGKIVVVGAFATYNGITQNGIVQLNSDGSIDNTFNSGTGFVSQINATTIAVQNDGKYVIGGTFTSYSGQTGNNRIIRLNTDGTKDTSFNVGTGIGNGQVNYIAIQPSDGKILVGGSFTLFTGSTQNRFIRLNTDGTKDSTFNIGTGFNSNVTWIAVQPDNKILASGLFSSYSGATVPTGLIRLNINGSRDTSFNIGTTGFDNTVSFISVLTGSSNSILVGGFFSSISTKTANKIAYLSSGGTYQTLGFVSRIDVENYPLNYNADQTLLLGDRSVLDRGFLNTELQANNGLNKSRYAGTNNMFQLGGALVNATTIGSSYPLTLNPSNLTLGNYGSTLSFSGNYVFGAAFNGNVATALVQNDGKYVIGGSFGTYGIAGGINATTVNTVANCFIRLNTDGSVDNAFIKGAGFGNGNVVNVMTFQPDNKIIAGGFFNSYMGFTTNMIARINTDGTVDTTFNTGSGFNSSLFAVAVQTGDSKVIAGGQYTTFTGATQNRLIRLNTNGTKDSTFNIGTGFNSLVESIIIQPDGKILVGGGFTTYTGSTNNRLIRLNSDATKDSTFNIGAGFNNTVIYLARQSDGKIIAVGSFTSYSGQTANHIIRLNTNGSIDNTFNVGTGFNGAAGVVVTIQPDGKILVGGNFTTFTGSTQNSLIRLNSNGTKDTTFNIGTGFNNLVAAINVLPNGKILVGGNFTTYQGLTVNRVVLLNSDGTMSNQITSDTVLNYTTNLSSKFGARSIPDVGYVTGLTSGGGSVTANNGLTKSGANIHLGGSLTGATQIGLGSNSITFTGTTGTLKYGSDLSANYTIRSLVDKGYVTGLTTTSGIQTANNGLTKSGTNVYLGGTLTGTTTITSNGNTSVNFNTVNDGFGDLGAIKFNVNGSGAVGFNSSAPVLNYLADRSSQYTARSVPDKGYVDGHLNGITFSNSPLNGYAPVFNGTNWTFQSPLSSLTVNNGLTESGNNIHLGGSLTGNTKVSMSTNSLTFTGTSSAALVSMTNVNSKYGYQISGTTILSTASNINSLQVGVGSIASAVSSTAIGNSSIASSVDSIAIGAVTKASAQGAIAMGYGINVGTEMQNSVQDSFALGFNSTTPDYQLTKGTLTTTNATQSTLLAYVLATGTTYAVRAIVTARESVSGASRAMFVVKALAYRESGGAVIEGGLPYQIEKVQSANASAWDATATVSGNNLQISVTGVASTTIHWKVILETSNVH